MKVAILVVSRNRPDLVERQVLELEKKVGLDKDIYVVECGTDFNNLTSHTSLWYSDDDFKGKCFGHNLLFDYVKRLNKKYDYFLFIMNDVFFTEYQSDPLKELIDVMESNPELAVLSPTNIDCTYPASSPKEDSVWRKVTTTDYLCLLMSDKSLEKIGFLNRDFKYCWGAIHELSYKAYQADLVVGYCDSVSYEHLGGSTYGKNTNTISREEYQTNAKLFASNYFTENYGEDWDKVFWSACERHNVEVNTFERHRTLWESVE